MSKLASLFVGKENGKDPETAPLPEEKGYTVLFVDDEKSVLSSMKRIFRKENYRILFASSGSEALDVIESDKVHVVISDHRMPGMTGAELLRKIKDLQPETIRIMLTGYADVNAVMGAINEGAVYKFITKPWNDEDLRLTVSLALEQYDLIQENRALKKHQKDQEKKIKRLDRFVSSHKSQVGKLLLKSKAITKEMLDRAQKAQEKSGKILPVILTEMGLVDEKSILELIQGESGINRVYPAEFQTPRAILPLIPAGICRNSVVVPLQKKGNRMVIAMADPTDFVKVDDLQFMVGIAVEPVIATIQEIRKKIDELYGGDDDQEAAFTELEITDPSESIEIIIEDDDEYLDLAELISEKDQPPAIRIVNAVISDALRHNASDVHIEPKTKYMMVRYRIDGLLQDKIHIPISMHPAIISRIKVMAELDIAERRRPQDGRVTVKTPTRMVDMRLSTLPTINGEKIVLRVLDRNASIKDVSELGFSDSDLKIVTRLMNQPQGCILTTGPTGSGKTSTLYSLLQDSATIENNYTTIEDPVEYFMSMAEQVMIREKIGLNFPMVLRAILRQDPNVIMLGEIRDFETAEVAFHAALTGHLVLSTLHTNGTIASVTRLRDMGIKSYVISDAIIGIIAQRLVRTICRECSAPDTPSPDIFEALCFMPPEKGFRPMKGKGCSKCNRTGYSGRIGLFEVFSMTREVKSLLHKDASEEAITQAARKAGMKTLLEDGVDKALAGLTTFEEILRVLGAQASTGGQCGHCSAVHENRFRFCPMCGMPIIRVCNKCNRSLEPEWRICPDCGEKAGYEV